MSVPIPRDKLISLINFSRQFISIRENEINLIENWCKMNHIGYNLPSDNKNEVASTDKIVIASSNKITQNDNHSINNVPSLNEDDRNKIY